jgi:putative oxidoreductase
VVPKNRAQRQPNSIFEEITSLYNFAIGIFNQSSHHVRMKIVTIIARVLLGLIFVVFGSNIFLHFIPMPPPPPGPSGDFTKALFVTRYLHVVGVFQIVGGLLLLIGRFVPLGLVLLAPVIVNIDLVHILMEPSGLPMATVISILLVFLVWRYRDAFAGIVRP